MFLHETAHHANTWIDSWRVETIVVSTLGMLVFLTVALSVDPDAVLAGGIAVVTLSPLWLPLVLFTVFWKTWMHWLRYAFWFRQPMTLLHIELPPEVAKSPLAMELVLVGLWNNGGETTFLQRIWKGQFRAITTLELVSNHGRIGYYIHLRKNWKEFIEARIYGQFPEAKITEMERDYVDEVAFNTDDYDLWGTEYNKKIAEAAPIKTYIDYGLDKNTDTPEIHVDPLTNILEFLSTVKQDEYVWLQIVMKARKKDEWYGFYTGDHFKDEGEKLKKGLTEGAIKRAQEFTTDDAEKKKVGSRGSTLLTEGERNAIIAIDRSLSKQVFDCGIRGLYIVKKGKFDLSRVNNLVRIWDPFRYDGGWQSLNVTRGNSIFDYPWQDWREIRKTMIRKKMFFWYKHRAYFYVPYDQKEVCMTTEELASMWHFPNSEVKTPALQRVPSRRSSAPSNLPI